MKPVSFAPASSKRWGSTDKLSGLEPVSGSLHSGEVLEGARIPLGKPLVQVPPHDLGSLDAVKDFKINEVMPNGLGVFTFVRPAKNSLRESHRPTHDLNAKHRQPATT